MLVFIDETGDHNMVNIHESYPIFGLGALLIDEDEYEKMNDKVWELKRKYFADDGTFILHSSELRRPIHPKSDERNKVMINSEIRKNFYEEFDTEIVTPLDYTILTCFIGKKRMNDQYYYPADPYYFSFENIINRVLRHGGKMNKIIAEKRGNELDTQLKTEYERLSRVGIRFHSSKEVIERTSLELVEKKKNINGLQVIDLLLSTLARYHRGKTSKIFGNDLTPELVIKKYACSPTFFPYRKK